jgi:hypothetical protein
MKKAASVGVLTQVASACAFTQLISDHATVAINTAKLSTAVTTKRRSTTSIRQPARYVQPNRYSGQASLSFGGIPYFLWVVRIGGHSVVGSGSPESKRLSERSRPPKLQLTERNCCSPAPRSVLAACRRKPTMANEGTPGNWPYCSLIVS